MHWHGATATSPMTHIAVVGSASCSLTHPVGQAFDHAPDRLGAVGSAIDVAVAKRSEFGGDLAQAAPLSRFGAGPMQPLGLCHDFGPCLEMRFRPSTLPLGRFRSRAAFSFSLAESLFELGKHAHDLPHGDPEFVVAVGQVVASVRQDTHAQANQQRYAGLLGIQWSSGTVPGDA